MHSWPRGNVRSRNVQNMCATAAIPSTNGIRGTSVWSRRVLLALARRCAMSCGFIPVPLHLSCSEPVWQKAWSVCRSEPDGLKTSGPLPMTASHWKHNWRGRVSITDIPCRRRTRSGKTCSCGGIDCDVEIFDRSCLVAGVPRCAGDSRNHGIPRHLHR